MASITLLLRDAAFALLNDLPGVKTINKNRSLHLKPSQLPAVSVFIAQEDMGADGDPNHGEPSFIHEADLVCRVLVSAVTSADADAVADAIVEDIKDRILTHPTFISSFEGVLRVTSRFTFPKQNEFQLIEADLRFTLIYRTDWPPKVLDDLREIAVTTVHDLNQGEGNDPSGDELERTYVIPNE